MDYAIVFLPLIGSIISGFFGTRLGDKLSQIICCLLVSISAILSIIIFYDVIVDHSYTNNKILSWINSGDLKVNWTINIDALTSIMLVVVCLISSLVHIYSIGYMIHDPHKTRFMSYLSLFTFAMISLITADNFLQLYFGWEGVGLCSYLLIGFWYKKPSANVAAIKAFIVNRVGDFGFAIGIFLIFYFFGTLTYSEVFEKVPQFIDKKFNFFGLEFNLITLICLLLFVGAMGKSAQIFFHTWLPDAMEGPTPVSALIHAATMVTAGVFLVVRCSPMFEYSETALNFVAIIGMLTAFFAATVALVQNDIKRIIAYSTCSQLGYMFFAAGIGAYHVAIFHLFTHAFFKALLFLGSGSVIHSFRSEQDIRLMGGIWKKLPYTWMLMFIGTLALTGFPFLSGYYSKDAIIEFAYHKQSAIGYYACAVGIITAFLTSIYSWRLMFKTFHGSYNNEKLNKDAIHESSLIMIFPLILLAIGAIFSGFFFNDLLIGQNNSMFWSNSILFLKTFAHEYSPSWLLILTPTIVVMAIPVAYYLFIKNKNVLKKLVSKDEPEAHFIYNFLLNKWYFDEIYNFIFVNPLKKIGIIFWEKVDIKIIDRFGPNGIAKIVKFVSDKAVEFQSGYLYHYAFAMLIGLSLLLTYLIIY